MASRPILDLRIITFFTFLRKDFLEMAGLQRPRVLVIIAHFLTFAKTFNSVLVDGGHQRLRDS